MMTPAEAVADQMLILIAAAQRRDTETAARLLDDLVVDAMSAFTTLVTLADIAARPLANAREVDEDLVIIDNFGSRKDLAAPQLIAAAANDDRDTLDALAEVVIGNPEHYCAVVVEVLSILVAQLGQVPQSAWQPRSAR